VDGDELHQRGARQPGAAAEEPVHGGVVRDEHGDGVPAVDLARDAGVGEEEAEELELRVPAQDLRDVEGGGSRWGRGGGDDGGGGQEEEEEEHEQGGGGARSHACADGCTYVRTRSIKH